MIVYGTKTSLLKSELIFDACPACGAGNSIQMNVFQRYVHVFWIPFLPAGKTGVSQCTRCKQVLKLKEMPESLKLSYNNLKAETRIPIWTFSGIVLMGALLYGASIHGKNRVERVSKMVLAPQKGDVFEVKLSDTAYSLMKISQVTRDSVFFVFNKYQTTDESGLEDLKSKEYDPELSVMTKQALIAMDKKEQILDIDRKQ